MSLPSAGKAHTYGAGCRLAAIPYPPEPDPALNDIPPLVAQFFYASIIPIDDPLSSVASSDVKPSAQPQRPSLKPFSHADNNALERAWLSCASNDRRRVHCRTLRNRSPSPSTARADSRKLAAICRQLVRKHRLKHQQEGTAPPSAALTPAAVPVCCPELRLDASSELRRVFCALARRRQRGLDEDAVVAAVMAELSRSASAPDFFVPATRLKSASISFSAPPAVEGPESSEAGSAPSSLPTTRTGRSTMRDVGEDDTHSLGSSASRDGQVSGRKAAVPMRPLVDDGISGMPFVRVGRAAETDGLPFPLDSGPSAAPRAGAAMISSKIASKADAVQQPTATGASTTNDEEEIDLRGRLIEVAVGVSRLHMVSLPILQMRPIYWSPVNDVAVVLRATWFYRDTMAPVDPKVANQLEAGYRELRPWTETWSDEIRCAIDVGALGEEKVTQSLWPQRLPNNLTAEDPLSVEPTISDDPFCAARCFGGAAAAEGTLNAAHEGEVGSAKVYANYQVLYRDARAAYLLKPSLKPSAYYGRRPVSKIVKGATIGIPLVRGFDRDAWSRIHALTPAGNGMKHPPQEPTDVPGVGRHTSSGVPCAACMAETERWRVNDLILVAHGIGQKFAERVESFHFTHAINAFRRALNVELGGGGAGKAKNGLMVLPVNWRHVISFDDDGTVAPLDSFGLKDIEPKTIPAVRTIISDVMFDIPFYMSHHKPRMIEALVSEANRVYRLWCLNNPGFAEHGRVHIIAHSLGSVMAIDVLSKQPTVTPRLSVDATNLEPNARHFEFETTNLFLLGSPAAFFLLLERGRLIPRRGRLKPGASPADVNATDVVGDQGKFGCIAVDNVYNIVAREDPIAYLLNSAIGDPVYAASLKVAYVPSTATGFLQKVRGLWGWGGSAAASEFSRDHAGPNKPPTVRLPSQVELEVHDFTREEVAERKAYLLNDNGQIDYFLRSGGGPLEIQYLNMLSAHSSYWTSSDLIRMICMEVGRKPGRSHTHPEMRAVKLTKRVIPGAF